MRMRAFARVRPRRPPQPGVLLILTARGLGQAGHGELTVVHPMPFGDGRPMNSRAAAGFCPREGQPRRRHHCGGGGREPLRRGGCRRGGGGGLRSVARRCDPPRRGRAGCAAGARAIRQQSRVRDRARRSPEDRSGDGGGRQGGRARAREQPARRQPDRAAFLSVRLRCARAIVTRFMPRASSRTICAAGSRSTRCTFPSTRSAWSRRTSAAASA